MRFRQPQIKLVIGKPKPLAMLGELTNKATQPQRTNHPPPVGPVKCLTERRRIGPRPDHLGRRAGCRRSQGPQRAAVTRPGWLTRRFGGFWLPWELRRLFDNLVRCAHLPCVGVILQQCLRRKILPRRDVARRARHRRGRRRHG
ncbi:hypothetical protein SDC9_196676 [bioreactor metagenome]|uniref:Uncharacterized protein n=1 Tax=bioreactor metagenome TaxID=1076179 RepID=A0A645IP95_9ZZZZ